MEFLQEKPVQVWCGTKAAITTVKNDENHKATKQIKIRYLFTRALEEEGRLEIQYCATSAMAADILTKSLPAGQFIKLSELIGVQDLKASDGT